MTTVRCKRRLAWAVGFVVLACLVAGCGNVYLSGEALTAAETSTLDSWQAVQRASADPSIPAWQKAYLAENFTQWRSFVRAAKRDLNWGPKLPEESAGDNSASGGDAGEGN